MVLGRSKSTVQTISATESVFAIDTQEGSQLRRHATSYKGLVDDVRPAWLCRLLLAVDVVLCSAVEILKALESQMSR